MTARRNLELVAAWVLISVVFGLLDERLTRVATPWIADAANSRWLWACFPLVVGLAIGGIRRGAIAGATGTPVALCVFYLVHDNSFGNAINGAIALLPVGAVVGAVAGAIGGTLRGG